MADEGGALAALMERIRSDSAETRLSTASALSSLMDDGTDPAAVLEMDADEDIKMMRGSLDLYYFSERSMTESYARHLFRLAERDPLRLIADTVRDESKTYPRPTPVATFADPPFAMSAADIEGALAAMAADPQYADIRPVRASNGDDYLYSATSLAEAHAAGLAEWASVGEKENP